MSWIISRALMDLYESSRSLPAAAEVSSRRRSLDGKPSAPSNGNRLPLLYSSSDKMTASSAPSLSGTTCEHLTARLGAEVLTWYLEDFLARTSAAPERGRDLLVRVPDYGVRWRALSMKYSPDTCLWRTPPSLWDEGWMWSLGTLPRWGSMQGGVLWERVTLARPINATAPGSLPTPVTYDQTAGRGLGDNYRGLGWQARYNWSADPDAERVPHVPVKEKEAKRLAKLHGNVPTPRASDGKQKRNPPDQIKQTKSGVFLSDTGTYTQMDLPRHVKVLERLSFESVEEGKLERRRAKLQGYPTPTANEERASRYTLETSWKHFSEKTHQVHLAQVVRDPRMMPTRVRLSTPTCTQPKMPPNTLLIRMSDGKHDGDTSVPLVEFLQREEWRQRHRLPTPIAHDGRRRDTRSVEDIERRENTPGGFSTTLSERVKMDQARVRLPTPTSMNGLRNGKEPGSSGGEHHPMKWQHPGHAEFGELNPEWVEWLMDWPIGWTSLEPMDPMVFQDWLQKNQARPDTGLGTWWDIDPSEVVVVPDGMDPAALADEELLALPRLIPKTVKPSSQQENDIRIGRIAMLGNGQVPAQHVAAVHAMLQWQLPEGEDE